MPLITKFSCTCKSCYDRGSRCSGLQALDYHSDVVGLILSGDQSMIRVCAGVGVQRVDKTCHSTLLMFHSDVIQREIRCQAELGCRTAVIEFLSLTEKQVRFLDAAITWCYTGKTNIQFEEADDHEDMWNFAVDLEMPGLANYCMKLIIQKYSWADIKGERLIRENHARYGPEGFRKVCYENRGIPRRNKLLCFVEDLICTRGPLMESAIQGPDRRSYDQSYINLWQNARSEDEVFGNWLNRLGGLCREADAQQWPTHPTQWTKYMMTTPIYAPQNSLTEFLGCYKALPAETTVRRFLRELKDGEVDRNLTRMG
ncbi:Uu.00g042210.m01.CDS01 [Anthostomella pinea]|uniref:Uu.00g042210.m01.CDS01 n=1 Tax=Anthostomella pinea TaxID=933095 RepID=A0AAI8V5J6_9PEZI|nr:Uu.00g042210.m01.CDS01 [Anthostomella pinea]